MTSGRVPTTNATGFFMWKSDAKCRPRQTQAPAVLEVEVVGYWLLAAGYWSSVARGTVARSSDIVAGKPDAYIEHRGINPHPTARAA